MNILPKSSKARKKPPTFGDQYESRRTGGFHDALVPRITEQFYEFIFLVKHLSNRSWLVGSKHPSTTEQFYAFLSIVKHFSNKGWLVGSKLPWTTEQFYEFLFLVKHFSNRGCLQTPQYHCTVF